MARFITITTKDNSRAFIDLDSVSAVEKQYSDDYLISGPAGNYSFRVSKETARLICNKLGLNLNELG